MSEISVMDYLEPLIKDRVKVNADLLSKIVLDIKFPDVNFNIDTMLPIGLLLNELVTNSLKHAFPDNREGKITVGLDILPDKSAILYYSDNGVGFHIEQAGDPSKSLGLILIDSFAMQLDGKLKRLDKPGTHYELKFKPI
jgi:two-component sensor histidine kinase